MSKIRSLSFLGVVGFVLLGSFGVAWASSIAATTIPNSSGAVTCNGENLNGSTATWTVGGSIAYNAWAGWHASQGFGYLTPGDNGNYNIMDSNLSQNPCEVTVSTSSNILANCPTISGTAYLAYTDYPSVPSIQQVLTYSLSGAVASSTVQAVGSFSNLSDYKNCQYKCTATQSGVSGSPTWTAATPYL